MWISRSPFSLMSASYFLDPPQDRWPGIHVSDVIKHLNSRKYKDNNDDSLMAMGRVWEANIRPWIEAECGKSGAKFIPSIQIRNKETGLVGNLDGMIEIMTIPSAAVECKFTTKDKLEIESEWAWLTQIKTYCYMLGVGMCWLVVLRLGRNPRGNPRAETTLNILTFTREEIEENWQMMVNGVEDLKTRSSYGNA